MTDLARDRDTIGDSLSNISDLTVVVADLVSRSRPLVKADVAKLRQLAHLLNEPESRKTVIEMLDRLPESMTDQTRTGTYGSWYSYYLCEFSGDIRLPELDGIPGIKELTKQLSNLRFHSTAPRCNCMALRQLLGRQDPAPRRDHRRGDAADHGGRRSTSPSSPASAAASTAPSSRTPAGCTPATWCRSPACAWAGSRRSQLETDKVLVTFEVDHGVEFGNESQASIEVLNLLGEKYLELTPAGSGQLDEDDVIPVDRTQSAYDIVGVFGDLTTTTERIDTEQLQQALERRVRHDGRRRAGHPGQLRGHLPAVADRRRRATRRSRRCSRARAASARCSPTAARTSCS